MSAHFVVISGCSGGGKSSLLVELAKRGFATVEEPGRRIVREELAKGGQALPWIDQEAFLRRVLHTAMADLHSAPSQSPVFFDRSLIDAASALGALYGDDRLEELGRAWRYHREVFIAPPWPALYVTDAERRHTFSDALQEYRRLRRDYSSLGFKIIGLPKRPIDRRADFIVKRLGL